MSTPRDGVWQPVAVEADGGRELTEPWPNRRVGTPPRWVTLAAAAIALHGIDAWVIRPERDRGLIVRGIALALIGALWGWMLSLWRRGGQRRQGAIAAALGAIALVTGVAITAFHVREFGLAGRNLSGIVSIGGAIVLLGAGTGIVVRSFRSRWRWALAIGAAALVVVYVLTPLTVAIYVTNPPHVEAGSRTPADAGLPYEDVTFTTEDGVGLSAWYVPSKNGASVLLLHGSAEARDVMLEHASMLARHGYGALLLDARGHGESDGTAMEWGWHASEDLAAAVTYLLSRPDVDPERIAALGLSMGAHSALTAAAQDDRISAVIAEGASARSFADVAPLASPLAIPGWWLQFAVADLLTDASPPMPLRDAVARIAPRPLLMIAGEEQREVEAGLAYVEAGTPTTSLWVLPDARHARALVAHPLAYEDRVVRFLDDALGVDAT